MYPKLYLTKGVHKYIIQKYPEMCPKSAQNINVQSEFKLCPKTVHYNHS